MGREEGLREGVEDNGGKWNGICYYLTGRQRVDYLREERDNQEGERV